MSGRLVNSPELRTSPAGTLVARMEIEYEGQVSGVLPLQVAAVRMTVVALGDMAEKCRELPSGTWLRVEGVLNQRRWMRGGQVSWGRLELVATRLEPQEPPPATSKTTIH